MSAQEEVDPLAAWLDASTELQDFERWLEGGLHSFGWAADRSARVRILDVGCGSGERSLLLLRSLLRNGYRADYHGIDPRLDRLAMFSRSAEAANIPVRLEHGDLESFVPEQRFDLVVAGHVLYYAKDMVQALRRLVYLGKEALIVHQGRGGLCTLRTHIPGPQSTWPYVDSTHEHVLSDLRKVNVMGATVRRSQFQSIAHVADCLNPHSKRGEALMRFMLGRGRTEAVHPGTVEAVRIFIERTCAHHGYYMTHEVGLLAITRPPE